MNTRVIKWSATLLLVSAIFVVEAQTTDELLQLGNHEVQGTARFTGLGGAFNALGGDFGSLSTNPAGIATYRSSEFVVTPSLTIANATTNFMGESLSDRYTRFGLANLGYVGTYLTRRSEGLVSINFGLGYNKTANFYKRTRLRGFDSPKSVLDKFEIYAKDKNLTPEYLGNNKFQNILPDDWSTAMAYTRGMIGYNENGGYFANGLAQGDVVDMYGSSIQTGGTEEFTLSLGANISNRFQIGMTVGLQDLKYTNHLNYREAYLGTQNDVDDRYLSSNRNEYVRTTGTGVNAKFGIIYRPINAFRLGFAVHTPTFFDMKREYSVSMSANYKATGDKGENSPSDIYEHTLITPYRMEFGLAYIFGKIGLISVDYELTGNSSMRIRDNIINDGYISSRNDAIRHNYRNTSNVRVGAEINLPRGLMLRAGFNYFQSPYKDSSFDFSRYAYSGGIGYRGKYFFTDLAYTLNTGKYHFIPYKVNDYRVRNADSDSKAVENLKVGRIIATIGFRF
ncbi:MAG: outer membrane protein transport protein [Prevotellaceae bacterium]|jgi:hypothetical protein|nr:outer membrane protein transport protein [Prevotellaceae bacterium]